MGVAALMGHVVVSGAGVAAHLRTRRLPLADTSVVCLFALVVQEARTMIVWGWGPHASRLTPHASRLTPHASRLAPHSPLDAEQSFQRLDLGGAAMMCNGARREGVRLVDQRGLGLA